MTDEHATKSATERPPLSNAAKVRAAAVLAALAVGVWLLVSSCSHKDQVSAADCSAVSQELENGIAQGQQDGVGMVPVAASAYRSPDFKEVYFVAMRFSASGVDDQVGVWATNRLDGTGAIMAIDGLSQQFTNWGAGETTDAAIAPNDPAVAKAKACLEG